MIERRNPLSVVRQVTSQASNLEECSMFWMMLTVFPQTSNLRIKKALLYVFEDNEAVIKMIIKGRSSTMRHVSRTHRVALDWLFDRINLDPKSKSSAFADMLTKGNFTRDEWNHPLCLFNISHFSSTVCSEVMSKRTQQELRWRKSHSEVEANDESYCKGSLNSVIFGVRKPGEEKLWKSESLGVRKLRNMIERCNPLSAVTQVTSTVHHHKQFVESSYSARYSGWGTMTKLGLLKSGKLINRWMIERGNPLSPLGQGHTSSNQVSLMRRPSTLFWKKKKLMIERWHPLSALKQEQGHSNSSLETTKQNWICR